MTHVFGSVRRSSAGWGPPRSDRSAVPTLFRAALVATASLALVGLADAQPVAINEINYRSADGFDPGDWIEFTNPGPDEAVIGSWSIKGEGDGELYVFPVAATIAGEGHVVVAQDPVAFQRHFPGLGSVFGPLGFGFSGGGELLVLLNGAQAVVDSVRYDDGFPWPVEPDGTGFTLALLEPLLDNSLPESWSRSLRIGGTPGTANDFGSLPVEPPRLVINEINYHAPSAMDAGDWLEIAHAEPEFGPILLDGWFLRDGADTNIFLFTSGLSLDPGGFIVVADDSAAFRSVHPNVSNFIGELPFNLSNGGEAVRLFAPEGRLVDSLSYDDEAPWPSEPDSTGPTLELLDTETDNADVANWRASLITGGTPGRPNSVVSTGANPDPPSTPKRSLSVFPNPVPRGVPISLSLPPLASGSVFVLDLLGRTVLRATISGSPYARRKPLPSGSLSPGVYFVRAETQHGSELSASFLVLE